MTIPFDIESVVSMINIGDVLILEPNYSEGHEKYNCKLVEKIGDKLYIDFPKNMETNRTVFLMEGTQMKATFIAQDGTVYLFESEVLKRVKTNIPMVVLSYPGKEQLIKIQRRQFVRVETAVDVAVHPTNELEFPPFVSITEDISAGGAAIIIDKQSKVQQNMIIDTWLSLPMQNGEIHYLRLKGKVIRILDFKENKSIISVQFIDISAIERQLLLRFSFDRQLALRKKGLEV